MIGAPPVRTVTKHVVEQPGCGKLDSRNAVRRTEIANPARSLRPTERAPRPLRKRNSAGAASRSPHGLRDHLGELLGRDSRDL